MNTVMTVKKGVVLAMALSAMMLSSAHALTVYTAGPGSLAKSLASGFEQQTGVKVTVFQATTGKVMARLEAEQANPQADVLISASWDTAEDLHQRGWLLPFASANADQVPANLKSADYIAQGVSALGIVWNSKSGTPEPKEWRDLTQPAFKDKVTTPDPALSGASLDLLIGLQNSMGDQAWQLFDDLKERHGSQRTQRPGGDAGDAGSESGGVWRGGLCLLRQYSAGRVAEGDLPGQRNGDCPAPDDDPQNQPASRRCQSLYRLRAVAGRSGEGRRRLADARPPRRGG